MPSIRRTLASLSSTTRILAFRISAELSMNLRPDSYALADLMSREFQRHVQRIHELTDLDRLGEIPEESRLQPLIDVARHCIRAESDHRDVRRGRVLAKDFQSFETTDAGQIDVHQDHLRLVGAGKLDAQMTVCSSQQTHVRTARDQLLD